MKKIMTYFNRALLVALSIMIFAPQAALAQTTTPATKPKIDYSDNNINWYDPRGNNVSQCGTSTGITTPAGSDHQQQAYNFFVGKGLEPMRAAAIVGNLMQESGQTIDPQAVNSKSGAYGIAQWLGSRMTNLKNYASQNGGDYKTFLMQINFLWYEVTQGTEKGDGAIAGVKAAADIEHATFAWEDKFERAGESFNSQPMQNRITNAKNVLRLYGGNSNTAPANNPTSDAGCANSAAGSGDIVKIALSQVGTKASGNGGSGDPMCKYLENSNCAYEAWCADFVSWVYKQAGVPFTGGVSGGWRIPGAANVKAWFQRNGIWFPNTGSIPPPGASNAPRPGDVVYYGYQHVNIVVSYDSKGVTIVGGNQGGHPGAVTTYPSSSFFSSADGWGRRK